VSIQQSEKAAPQEAEKIKADLIATGLDLSGEGAPCSMAPLAKGKNKGNLRDASDTRESTFADAGRILDPQGIHRYDGGSREAITGYGRTSDKAQSASQNSYTLPLPKTGGVDGRSIGSTRAHRAVPYRGLISGDVEGTPVSSLIFQGFSLAPNNLDSTFSGIYDAFKRSPDLRRGIGLAVARILPKWLKRTGEGARRDSIHRP
jgi:hypothetical protein